MMFVLCACAQLSDHYPGYRYILPIQQITGLHMSHYQPVE